MKIYTIIGGVNGVGKSSLTGVLSSRDDDLGIIIDTDKITFECGGNKILGGKKAIEKIDFCLEHNISFTQETTLAGKRTLKTVQNAIDKNYKVRLYYVGVNDVSESLKRIRNRVEKGGHNIPSDDVQRRYESRFKDLEVVLPYCNEVVFYDNENGFIEVAEYRNGTLTIKGEYVPRWLAELKKYLVA